MERQEGEVLVLGAGAAGLAAAQRLRAGGARVLLIEARARAGGRVWTDRSFAEQPIEHGAELIHGRHTATVALAAEAGLRLAPVQRYSGLRWANDGPALPLAALDPATREMIVALRTAYADLPRALAPGGALVGPAADRSLADELRARGFDEPAIAVADVLLAQTCCASVHTLSCADLAREQLADRAGPEEFRIVESYAPLIAHLARDLEIVYSAPARAVRWGRDGVTVTTGAGVYRAARCLISVPVGVLQAGAIVFDPPLEEPRQRAIGAFRLEAATKLFLRFDTPLWDPELVYMAHPGALARWWTPAHHIPGAALICAYVTSGRARHLDTLDDAAARELALAELGQLLGVVDIAAHCLGMRRVAWAADPYARGGYAHIPPGAAAARPILAAPAGNSLFFAGEATAYDSNPQTVHGAIESGRRAADECLASL